MELRSGSPDEAGMSPSRVRYVAKLAESWVAQGITPALGVLVARRGIIVLHEAFGRRTPEPDSPPLQRDTLYPLASLTKPITAAAVMVLVEDGLLGLNRPVAEYIPEFTGEGKQAVMVHHLLTHTSGLRDADVAAYAEETSGTAAPTPSGDERPPDIWDTPSLGYGAPLWKPPGTEMSYCSYGCCVLAEIISRVSGKSFEAFTRERIFAPLGMKETGYVEPDLPWDRVVQRPEDAPGAVWLLRDQSRCGGGALSTARDMAIFGQMFLNGGCYGDARVLSPASVAAMTRNQIPGIGARHMDEFFPEAFWGLGWGIDGNKRYLNRGTLQSPDTFSHGGAGGVFLWIDPAYEIVGAYFSVSLWLVEGERVRTGADLFVNAVTSAITDG
jgi:CubicO group peptidase (beta-lactamase class C family)